MDKVEADAKQVNKCIEIALSCVEADRRKRPSIGDIVKALNETETLILHKTSEFPHRRSDLGLSTDQVMQDQHKSLKLHVNEYNAWKAIYFHHPSTFDTLAIGKRLKQFSMHDLDGFVMWKYSSPH